MSDKILQIDIANGRVNSIDNIANKTEANIFTENQTISSNFLNIGSDISTNTITNAANKVTRLTMPHYLSDTQPNIHLISGFTFAYNNIVYVGGGSGTAATEVRIYAADDSTTGTGSEMLKVSTSEIVLNESSYDCDIRIESDTNPNAFFLEGSSGNIGIGENLAIYGRVRQNCKDTSEEAISVFTGNNTTRARIVVNNKANGDASFSYQGNGSTKWSTSYSQSDGAFTITENIDANTNIAMRILPTSRRIAIGNAWASSKLEVFGDNGITVKNGDTLGFRYFDNSNDLKFLVNSKGDVWAKNNVSALSFTDRTPYPENLQQAIDVINSMEKLDKNSYDKSNKEHQLNHEKLHSYIKSEDGYRDLSATVSCLNEVVKYLLNKLKV